jgi:hypothetical protein
VRFEIARTPSTASAAHSRPLVSTTHELAPSATRKLLQ